MHTGAKFEAKSSHDLLGQIFLKARPIFHHFFQPVNLLFTCVHVQPISLSHSFFEICRIFGGRHETSNNNVVVLEIDTAKFENIQVVNEIFLHQNVYDVPLYLVEELELKLLQTHFMIPPLFSRLSTVGCLHFHLYRRTLYLGKATTPVECLKLKTNLFQQKLITKLFNLHFA